MFGVVLAAAGCVSNRTDKDRFIPSETTAHAALEKSLNVWCSSGEPGQVQDSGPAIHLVDSHHRPGQKLVGFVVLGSVAGDAERCYAARLTFEGPHDEVRARYVVFGQDPLWVVRYEDYEMIIHWDHPHLERGSTEVGWRSADDPR
jgi:hypothetical protein